MDTRELVGKLRLGVSPVMTGRDAMMAGDELQALLDGRELGQATLNDSAEARLRDVLVDFGALEPDDMATPIFDLLGVLLPPASTEKPG